MFIKTIRLLLSIFIFTLEYSYGLTPPHNNVRTIPKISRSPLATAAAVLTVCCYYCTSCLLPCQALDVSIYNQDYEDPLHPLCQRHIRVNSVANTFHYSGTDVFATATDGSGVKLGCSFQEQKEFGLQRTEFDGTFSSDGKISAGDGIHEGVWEPANSATTTLGFEDLDGIRWIDGNKWTVKSTSTATKIGGFVFYAYLTASTFAGIKGIADGIRKRRME
jgi:hypothetical protein